MAFELKQDEPVGAGLARIIDEQLESALARLDASNKNDENAIHDVRKRIKRMRAVLRMSRYAIGKDLFRRENAAFRDIAKPLSEIRDAAVLIDTFDRLQETSGTPVDITEARCRSAIRIGLREHRRRIRTQVLIRQHAIANARNSLEQARSRLKDWGPHMGSDWPAILHGVQKIYRAGYRAVQAADVSTDALHQWRKSAKYLWHQLQILQPLWPGMLKGLAQEYHALTECLGDDHDLAVLGYLVHATPDHFGGTASDKFLAAAIDPRRQVLQHKAFVSGRLLYQDRPKVFAERIGAYWESWQE
jgi:CHAD domain-containing protein